MKYFSESSVWVLPLRLIGYTTHRIESRLTRQTLAWNICFRQNQVLELLRKKPRARRAA